MITATVTTKGQITIPVAVREALGLAAGDKVERSATVAGCSRTVTFDRAAAKHCGTILVQ